MTLFFLEKNQLAGENWIRQQPWETHFVMHLNFPQPHRNIFNIVLFIAPVLTQTTFSSNRGILCFHSRFSNFFDRKLFKVVLLHYEYMRKRDKFVN